MYIARPVTPAYSRDIKMVPQKLPPDQPVYHRVTAAEPTVCVRAWHGRRAALHGASTLGTCNPSLSGRYCPYHGHHYTR